MLRFLLALIPGSSAELQCSIWFCTCYCTVLLQSMLLAAWRCCGPTPVPCCDLSEWWPCPPSCQLLQSTSVCQMQMPFHHPADNEDAKQSQSLETPLRLLSRTNRSHCSIVVLAFSSQNWIFPLPHLPLHFIQFWCG